VKLRERAYLKITNAAPQGIASRLDQLRALSLAGLPLNGQRQRQQIVRDLVASMDFDDIVETGTFRGASTLFFSQITGRPVHSVELLPRYFRFAERRCAGADGVDLRLGDSRAFLRDMSLQIGGHTTFFYLDAHWQPDVPRFEEMEIIAGAWQRAVVMIDDFAVPDDAGYGFVQYGDIPLTIDYLPELPGWTMSFPAAPSDEETGAKRGSIVLASPELAAEVSKVPTLRQLPG
jgi:predicted O-methyltransferase YrrM